MNILKSVILTLPYAFLLVIEKNFDIKKGDRIEKVLNWIEDGHVLMTSNSYDNVWKLWMFQYILQLVILAIGLLALAGYILV